MTPISKRWSRKDSWMCRRGLLRYSSRSSCRPRSLRSRGWITDSVGCRWIRSSHIRGRRMEELLKRDLVEWTTYLSCKVQTQGDIPRRVLRINLCVLRLSLLIWRANPFLNQRQMHGPEATTLITLYKKAYSSRMTHQTTWTTRSQWTTQISYQVASTTTDKVSSSLSNQSSEKWAPNSHGPQRTRRAAHN